MKRGETWPECRDKAAKEGDECKADLLCGIKISSAEWLLFMCRLGKKAGWLLMNSISESHCSASTMIGVCAYNSAQCIGTETSYLHNGIPSLPSAVLSFCQLIVHLPDRKNEGERDRRGCRRWLEIRCDVAASFGSSVSFWCPSTVFLSNVPSALMSMIYAFACSLFFFFLFSSFSLFLIVRLFFTVPFL